MTPRQWLEKTLKANKTLTDDQRAAALADFDAQQDLANEFNTEFVQRAQYQSDLQKRDNRIKEVEGWNVGWKQGYAQLAQQHGDVAALKAAGVDVEDLEDLPGGGARDTRTGDTITRAELMQMLKEQREELLGAASGARDVALSFNAFANKKRGEYQQRYGKPFDDEAFRKFGFDNRAKYGDFDTAYRAYVAEDEQKFEVEDRKKWEAAKTKEIEQRVRSGSRAPEYGSGAPPETTGAFHAGAHTEFKPGAPRYSYSIDGAGGINASPAPVISNDESKSRIAERYKDHDLDLARVRTGGFDRGNRGGSAGATQ